MANMIKGEEQKFALNITAEGFSMDADDFDVEISSSKASIIGKKVGAVSDTSELYKTGSEDVTISREPGDDGGWFVIAETEKLTKGDVNVTITAYVKDTAANDGTRKSLARAKLGTLIN